ncbi:glycosyltransferase family 4 protein [Tenacibaculum retecalamus]|uniref:glycosyltransferase family 4 protein n=1 Tax=Tenacibaculum retecalamus TaxID=3018315 RepID=UPI0023D929A1|nr:glycosyltransferase family 4 protein [Tenacibaculum retecalamus]WBX70733.1 glycosyltransferase family 4 protein [Tenacibaculum retecalamus]
MKIVYCTDQVYLHGGIEKVLAQKINYFINKKYEVHLITSEQKGKSFCYEMNKKLHFHDLSINYTRTKSYFSLDNLKQVPKHFKSIKEKLEEIKPDVIVICNYTFDFYFIPLLSKKTKTIREFHASRFYSSKDIVNASFMKKMMNKVNNFFEKKYSHVVLLNNDEKQYYKSNNLTVIPNAILFNKNTSIRSGKREQIVIAAGRIAPVKQFDHLIDVWEQLYNKHQDWSVHIYGEGNLDLVKELDDTIKQRGIKNIEMKGVTNQLEDKMKEASIYAMTSLTECFPMVLLEALSSGLPVISYNSPHGPKNIISNKEDGVIVKHNDIESFTKQLSELITNEKKREEYSKNAYKNVIKFHEDIIMDKWVTLFKK